MDKQVKPNVLDVFGEVALAIGPNFIRYQKFVLPLLVEASQANIEDKVCTVFFVINNNLVIQIFDRDSMSRVAYHPKSFLEYEVK